MIRPPKGCILETDSRVAQFGHPAPAWLFPYADLMTELVCFFVILYALSASLDKGMVEGGEKMEQVMDTMGIEAEVEFTKEGMKLSLSENEKSPFFESGFAELTPKMQNALGALAREMRKQAAKGHMIYVEGHTDDIPIHNEYFFSNWELSTARATSVVEYLINDHKFPSACIAAMGFGDNQPKCSEKTRECRGRNRRVVFLIRNNDLRKTACSALFKEASAESSKLPSVEGGEAG